MCHVRPQQRTLPGIMKCVRDPLARESRESFIVPRARQSFWALSSDLTRPSSQNISYPGSSFSPKKNIIHSALVAAAFVHLANIIIPSLLKKGSVLRLVPLFLAAVAVVGVDAVQRLEHDDGVAADHAHAQADLLVVGLALGGFVEDDVEEDVVAAQRAHDFARAVELHFDALVEVLLVWRLVSNFLTGLDDCEEGCVRECGTFLSSGCAWGILNVDVWSSVVGFWYACARLM